MADPGVAARRGRHHVRDCFPVGLHLAPNAPNTCSGCAALGRLLMAPRATTLSPAELPQLFADMFGWPEQAGAVAAVYHRLPEAERAQAVLVAYNYGEASAIDYFGKALGLPRAISGHNQY